MSTWLLVPCPRSRLPELRDLLTGIWHDPQYTVVVTTDPDPIRPDDLPNRRLIHDTGDGISFSRWLNLGLDHIAAIETPGPYEVCCIGSDVRAEHTSILRLAQQMRTNHLVMVGPDLTRPHDPLAVRVLNGMPRTVYDRIPGCCFMLAAEHRLRLDETLRWWYSDDDLELQARSIGNVALVTGTGIVHDTDHALDGQRAGWAIEDRARFIAKWGIEPW